MRQFQDVQSKVHFWGQFIKIPGIEIDFQAIETNWQSLRESLSEILGTKLSSPLESLELTANAIELLEKYSRIKEYISNLHDQLQTVNDEINGIKSSVTQANLLDLKNQLKHLQLIEVRFEPAINSLCDTYLQLKQERGNLEISKTEARRALDQYRESVFPAFQTSINFYLNRFNTGFEIVNVQPYNAAGRPSSLYQIRINNTDVNLNSDNGGPSFKNTLSGGDRNVLALSFFLACLDQEPDLQNRVVVLDDIIASLDEHRKLVTVEEVCKLLARVSQVIVLSHNKSFLCEIWKANHGSDISTSQIRRIQGGSDVTTWDPTDDSMTTQDRSIAALCEYRDHGHVNAREIAVTLRLALEGYIRAKFPNHFPPGSLLGNFINSSRTRIGQSKEILNEAKTNELNSIVNYGNRYHHDSNPNWTNESINDGELMGYVNRTLDFIQS